MRNAMVERPRGAAVGTREGERGRTPVLLLTTAGVLALLGVVWVLARGSGPPNPFAGVRLFVADATPASSAIEQGLAAGASAGDVRALQVLAAQPTASWFGDWVPADRVTGEVSRLVGDATSRGEYPVLVAYAIPGRDCDQQSAGGASSADAYRSWMLAFASGIGERSAAVVLEPDALSQLDCLSDVQRADRTALLAFAVDTLAAYPAVSVYLDAGHSSWIPADEMAGRLRSAGIDRARGFALNVSNFGTTSEETHYGDELSALVDDKPFVVDTSRNGNGRWAGEQSWCNPPVRALGAAPLTPVDDPRVDALLWIKTPGASDGACRPGEPPAGTFWPKYAVGLVTRSALAPTR
jgi:endoglucanase